MIIITVTLIIFLCIIFFQDIKGFISPEKIQDQQIKKEVSGKRLQQTAGIQINDKTDLPDILKEVSGIAYLSEGNFACIQDEKGSVFMYDKSTNKIKKEIQFAPDGDYEGIALVNKTAYVIRADGVLFEIDDIQAARPKIKEYKTHLTVDQNVEGLCYDKAYNRLLLSIKDSEGGNRNFKGVYAFDLKNKTLAAEPVYKIDLTHTLLNATGKKNKTFMPSDIGVHPVSGEIYIIDGPGSRLLILDKTGNPSRIFALGKDFSQPEGITFDPVGRIFISNEGNKEPGNIMEVSL